ncbi:hypothetical protein WH50_08160 [Pokkaliibacter plantistimulans]|uniref:Peptidase n=1 Tax=Pokkaliibacter plantistimulans TaxID=1635171 RepID=A0ABX5LZQ5_9GAMM|nr:hypothetical protein WH50_08160 [Pokkaliibacter plantistimulans]
MLKGKVLRAVKSVHWISSALALACLLLFSVTGITLNHPDWFDADPTQAEQHLQLPEELQQQLMKAVAAGQWISVQPALLQWLSGQGLAGTPQRLEAVDNELHLDYQRPGGYRQISIYLDEGVVEAEEESRGLVAILNDLHKGRHAGAWWSALIDLTAVIILVFSVSGLVLLYHFASQRGSTWPLVTVGCAIPLLIYLVAVP